MTRDQDCDCACECDSVECCCGHALYCHIPRQQRQDDYEAHCDDRVKRMQEEGF